MDVGMIFHCSPMPQFKPISLLTMAVKRKRSSVPFRRAKKARYTPLALSRKVNKTSDIPSAVFDRFLIPFANQGKVTRIARHFSFPNVTGSAAAPVAGALVFRLSDLPGYTDFTNLYDQYRFVAVSVKFIASYPEYNAVPAGTSQWGLFFTALDLDDGATPTVGLLHENATMIASHPTRDVTRRLVPHSAVAAYAGAFTSYANKIGDWIDSSSPGVDHYGVKYLLEACVGTSLPIYNVEATYALEFRSTH